MKESRAVTPRTERLDNKLASGQEGRIKERVPARIFVLVGVLVLARLVHLDADTPLLLGTEGPGLYVDEGYKTLDPKNLVEHGARHWSSEDDYQGWMLRSPLTQLSYLAAFKVLGVGPVAGRLVSVACAALLLVLVSRTLARRYSLGRLYLVLAVVGLCHVFLFASRTIVFEVPLALSLAAASLLGQTESASRRWRGGLVLMVVATLGIKHSAPLYFAPLFLGWLVAGGGLARQWRVVLGIFAVLLIATAPIWLARLGIDAGTLHRTLLFRPTRAAGFLIAAAFFGLALAFLREGRGFLSDPYRAGLAMTCILGPVLLGLFPYNPLRYHLPFLPLYGLLAVEALSVGAAQQVTTRERTWVAAVLVAWAVLVLVQPFGWQLPSLLIGAPLLPERKLLLVGLGVGALAAMIILRFPSVQRRLEPRLITWLLVAALAVDLGRLVDFFARPSYATRSFAEVVRTHLSATDSVAGDWAPYVALYSGHRALFVNREVNTDRLEALRPSHLILTDTAEDMATRAYVARSGSLRLSEPLASAELIGRRVTLHRLVAPPR